MGLMMAERLAALHGGWLSVVSEVQRGSRFTVHLPLHRGPGGQQNAAPWADGSTPGGLSVSAPTPGSDSTSSAAQAPLVLIAEDNELNLEIIQRFLMTKGYRVAAARDGQAALALAALVKPAVVLMDVQMPGMDGLEATRRMRQDPQLMHLPVVALTALAMEGDRERCMAAGATAYLAKPVSLRQLAQLLQRYIQGESPSPKA
jgi:CheY-like chemotaxis protein